MTGKRLVIDTSKCIGCRACQVACKQWHSLPSEDTAFTGEYTNPPDMSGANLTVAKFTETEAGGKVKWLFFKDMCRHCNSPTCVASCPRHAIIKQANGMVRIDSNLCDPSACSPDQYPRLKPCQLGCKYKNDGPGGVMGIPKWKYTKDSVLSGSKMRKCDFCFDRWKTKSGLKNPPFVSQELLPNGKPAVTSAVPACQVTCPPGAITSGGAGATLKKANSRVNYLKANGYPNANVYPDQYTDQTHVIWILTENKSVYGL
jgi:Fe-S-cluster-containing dehydrogenase component